MYSAATNNEQLYYLATSLSNFKCNEILKFTIKSLQFPVQFPGMLGEEKNIKENGTLLKYYRTCNDAMWFKKASTLKPTLRAHFPL